MCSYTIEGRGKAVKMDPKMKRNRSISCFIKSANQGNWGVCLHA